MFGSCDRNDVFGKPECAVQHHARACIDFLVAGKVIGQSIFSPAIGVGIRRPMVGGLTICPDPIRAMQDIRVSCRP
jgi:hypothetical protein